MHSEDGHFIGAIKGFEFAKLKLNGFAEDNMGERIGGQGLGGTTGTGGWMGGGGMREQNVDKRNR